MVEEGELSWFLSRVYLFIYPLIFLLLERWFSPVLHAYCGFYLGL